MSAGPQFGACGCTLWIELLDRPMYRIRFAPDPGGVDSAWNAQRPPAQHLTAVVHVGTFESVCASKRVREILVGERVDENLLVLQVRVKTAIFAFSGEGF